LEAAFRFCTPRSEPAVQFRFCVWRVCAFPAGWLRLDPVAKRWLGVRSCRANRCVAVLGSLGGVARGTAAVRRRALGETASFLKKKRRWHISSLMQWAHTPYMHGTEEMRRVFPLGKDSRNEEDPHDVRIGLRGSRAGSRPNNRCNDQSGDAAHRLAKCQYKSRRSKLWTCHNFALKQRERIVDLFHACAAHAISQHQREERERNVARPLTETYSSATFLAMAWAFFAGAPHTREHEGLRRHCHP
jgi:hypothetical protein